MGAAYTFWGVMHMMVMLPTFPVFLAYLAMVFTYRFWKRHLPALKLTKIIAVHNVLCILLSAAAFVAFAWYLTFKASSIYARETDQTLQRIFVLYSFSKMLELLDTVFMMLKQKGRQISTLHVYHHATMLLLSDCGYRIFPWPCMAVPVAINSFVHILVYSYYLGTNLGIDVTPYKQALTQVQLIQFFVGLPFMWHGYFHHGFCIYGFIYDMSMIWFFGNFYVRNYWGWFQKKSSKSAAESVMMNGHQNGKVAVD